MGFFKQVEGEAAIVVINGVYKQCDIFERDGYLYAKAAGGFVRLFADGATTKAKMRLETLSIGAGEVCRDNIGRLCRPGVSGAIAIEAKSAQLLLGAPAE
jgi:hypothetical protein